MKAKVVIPFLLLVAIFTCSFAMYTAPVVWSENRALQWSDFHKVRPDKPEWGAAVSCEMDYTLASFRDTFTVTIVAQLRPELSWYDERDTTAYLLNHEQRHFDIAEYHARKLRRRAHKNDGHTVIWNDLNNELVYLRDSLALMQDKYDTETKHGIDRIKQEEWNKRIDSLLLSMDAYKTQTFNKGRFPAK